MTDQKYFQEILRDPSLIRIYQSIEEYDIKNGLAKHGLDHVYNVMNFTCILLSGIGCEPSYIESSQIAAYLHDIGCMQGRENHAKYSYDFCRKYLADVQYREEILSTILEHSTNEETVSLMASAVRLADKIDITKNRLGLHAFEEKGIRQLQYIKDVFVDVRSNEFTVSFHSSSKIDMFELHTFQFLQKLKFSLIQFSNLSGRKWNLKMNDIVWDI